MTSPAVRDLTRVDALIARSTIPAAEPRPLPAGLPVPIGRRRSTA